MFDKENNEIKVGDLIKKTGYVKYAHDTNPGETVHRYKVSRKTWQVAKVENGKAFYRVSTTDFVGRPIEQDLPIPWGKDAKGKNVEFLKVGDSKGMKPEFKAPTKTIDISPGGVGENYEVLKDVKQYQWKKGDVVRIHGKVSFDTLEKGYLKKVGTDVKNKHVLVVADPKRVGLAVNKPVK